MRQYLAGKIRNVAVAGHNGAGKTSLCEALLFKANAIDRLGKVTDGNTVSDFDPEEIKRKVSVSSAVIPFNWGSAKINLLDTPGMFDFEAGLYEGVMAAESVLITVSGRSGVSVGAEKAYKMAVKNGKSCIFFVSKLDTEHADFYKVLEGLKSSFGPSVCPVVVPFMNEGKVECYINLIDMKAYTYDAQGNAAEVAMPDAGHRIEGLVEAIGEAVAETDEALFDKFFSGEKFTRDEMIKGIHDGVKSGAISPVFCGSTATLEGVDMLLDAMVDLLPSAWESISMTAEDAAGEAVEVQCDDELPMSAVVFKTIADPFIGKLSFVKVITGQLSGDITPVNARTGQPDKFGKVIFVTGKKQGDTSYITAGDIGAITKLSETRTGDTLCDPKRILSYQLPAFPRPTYSMAIKAKAKGDEGKIASSIQRLMEEDPTIGYEQNPETKQQILSGLGEQHLDVILSKLKTKFGVDVTLEAPKVQVVGKHKKQTGGHGQFGHVVMEFEPWEGLELKFEEKVVGGSVPKGYFPAVEKGLQDCIQKGVLAGFPLVGLKATLLDGSYHPVDSSEMAFKLAAGLAYRDGIPQASPVILEPIGNLKVLVPDSNTGDIMGDINKRRGRVLGMNPDEEGLQLIEAEVPMSEMQDFTTALRSMTQGRGSFALAFDHYEQLPSALEAAVIEASKSAAE